VTVTITGAVTVGGERFPLSVDIELPDAGGRKDVPVRPDRDGD